MGKAYMPVWGVWALYLYDDVSPNSLVHALRQERRWEPCTGNLYARFDEGRGFNPRGYSTGQKKESEDQFVVKKLANIIIDM